MVILSVVCFVSFCEGGSFVRSFVPFCVDRIGSAVVVSFCSYEAVPCTERETYVGIPYVVASVGKGCFVCVCCVSSCWLIVPTNLYISE